MIDANIEAIDLGKGVERWPRFLSALFAGVGVSETVVTRVEMDAGPEKVWQGILFYEEVPGRAPWLLRTFMPCPVRTEGGKGEVGATVLCTYHLGDLVKRITAVEPPRLIAFEVVEQCLGIEGCVRTEGGSYEIQPRGDGSTILLRTRYRAFLHPRWLWRPWERVVTNQLHHHVLQGIGASVGQASRVGHAAAEVQ